MKLPAALTRSSRSGQWEAKPGHIVSRFRLMEVALVAGLLAFFNLRAPAHTLPISYVFVVTDKDYVHLELSFNPFELASFADLDANKNGRLDPEELALSQEKLSRQILDHLVLSADGKPVTAETAGIVPDGDTHHATLRAHYQVDASRAALTLESTLQEITSSSHLSQVNFLRDGKPQLAQLDSQSHQVSFTAPAHALSDPALPMCGPACSPANGGSVTRALGTAFAVIIFVAFRQTKRSPSATNSENPSHLNPTPKP